MRLLWKPYLIFIIWWSKVSLKAIMDYYIYYPVLVDTVDIMLDYLEENRKYMSKDELKILIREIGNLIRLGTRYRADLINGDNTVPKEYRS